jgi:NAD(P) transhydrogenase subunit alpha
VNADIPTLIALANVLDLAVFVGFEVISKVPVVLHTPLMSGTNAIHGIVMLGGVLVLATADRPLLVVLGAVAVIAGAANLFGGFVVTDRMLEMFKPKKTEVKKP